MSDLLKEMQLQLTLGDLLEDSLVLANLLIPSMVVEEERFIASITTCEITEVFQNCLGWYFSYYSFVLVVLVMSLNHLYLENLGFFIFHFSS